MKAMKISFKTQDMDRKRVKVSIPFKLRGLIVHYSDITDAEQYFTELRDKQRYDDRKSECDAARATLKTASVYSAKLLRTERNDGWLTFIFKFPTEEMKKEFKENAAKMITDSTM